MLSIIIPAYNEEKYIEKTLKSIKEQNFKDYELIIVCNGCSDKTYSIAKKYTKKVFNLKEKNVSKARNFGAKMAKRDLLIFLDADTQFVNKSSLNILVNGKRNAIGTCKFFPNKNNIMYKCFSLVKNIGSRLGMANGILFCDKDLFKKLEGYNTDMHPMENGDLIKRAKRYGKFQILPKLVITSMRRHESLGYVKSLRYWIKKFFFNGVDGYKAVR